VWKLQSIQRAGGPVVPVSNPDQFTIEFGADGRLAVRADFNRCTASYSTETLRVNPLMACTRAFCPTAPLDTEFTGGLTDAVILRTGENTLEALSNAGVLTFSR
jgi:heat shock protein HslJ